MLVDQASGDSGPLAAAAAPLPKLTAIPSFNVGLRDFARSSPAAGTATPEDLGRPLRTSHAIRGRQRLKSSRYT